MNKPYRWMQDNMLLERDVAEWSPGYMTGEGKGDALWRTSFASIAYYGTDKGKAFLDGVISCFKIDGDKIKAWRYPVDYKEDSVSRDQLTMAFVALAFNNRKDLIKKFHMGLDWELSPPFSQTIDFWIWSKAVSGSWIFTQLFWILSIILIPINIIWNKVLFSLGKLLISNGYGEINPNEFSNWTYYTKLDDFIYKVQYPHFAFHQFCWQMYVMPKHPIKFILSKICKLNRFKSNLMIRLLLGEEVSKDEIDSFHPMTGMCWQNRMNITTRGFNRKLKEEEFTEFNYDKDLLYSIKNI